MRSLFFGLVMLSFATVIDAQSAIGATEVGTSTAFVTASAVSNSPQALPSSTITANPNVATFYLPSPTSQVGIPFTSIVSVSLVGSGVSGGVTYTTYVEERVVEIPAATMTTLVDSTPVDTALASGSTTTITGLYSRSSGFASGTMVSNGQSWTFTAPDFGNFVENCTISPQTDAILQMSPLLECSYNSTNGFGGSIGSGLAEYTLILDSSNAVPSSTGSLSHGSDSGSETSLGSDSGSSVTSTATGSASDKSANGSGKKWGSEISVAGAVVALWEISYLF